MAYPWEDTSLGSRGDWHPGLATLVDTVLSHGFPMIALVGPELLQIYNDGYAEILAAKNATALGQPTQVCWPEVWHINGPIYERVLRGEVVTIEDGLYPLARSGPLQDAWFTLTYSPIHDQNGEAFGVLVTMIETTRRVLAERDRDEMMERQRIMLTLADSLREVSEPEAVRARGLEVIASQFGLAHLRLVPTDRCPPPKHDSELVLPILSAGVLRAVMIAECPSGQWSENTKSLLAQAAERLFSAIEKAQSEQDLRAALRYQRLLLGELQHRVRNSLTLISRIAERSGDSATDVETYRDAFLGRLASFARVQTAVTESPDEGLELRKLLEDELESQPVQRIRVSGPPATLCPRSAERMALALHELGVNAAKHGAFRHDGGALSVSWQIDEGGIELNWIETGVPVPDLPVTRGFGSEILQSALVYDLGAKVAMTFAQDGLVCSIQLPAENLQ